MMSLTGCGSSVKDEQDSKLRMPLNLSKHHIPIGDKFPCLLRSLFFVSGLSMR